MITLIKNWSLWDAGSKFRLYSIMIYMDGSGRAPEGIWKEAESAVHGIKIPTMNDLLKSGIAVREEKNK